jgi:hypothetical protein
MTKPRHQVADAADRSKLLRVVGVLTQLGRTVSVRLGVSRKV